MRKYIIEKDHFHVKRITNLLILSILPVGLICLAFIMDSPQNILRGLYNIIIAPDILLTDYIEVGGIGAAFLNAGILSLISIIILHIFKLKVNGMLIAATYTITGFAFIGKNIVNIWPIYLGGYLYSKYKKTHLKSIILILMFGTSLSPVISEIALGLNLSKVISIPLGITVGILIGFIITPLSSSMVRFHDGYNLYNIGFTGGMIGTLIASILRSFGIFIKTQSILSNNYSMFLRNILIVLFVILIAIGVMLFNRQGLKRYAGIFKYTGRIVTDFTILEGYGITYINMGIMGLICILYVIISGGTFNGPIIAGILTVVGFSAFGNHPMNSIPILIGVYLASSINVLDKSSTTVIISALFGTTIAPLAGAYGWLLGIIAGFLHLSVVTNVIQLHGGINLYNNGLAGGIVAAILAPLAEAFNKEVYRK